MILSPYMSTLSKTLACLAACTVAIGFSQRPLIVQTCIANILKAYQNNHSIWPQVLKLGDTHKYNVQAQSHHNAQGIPCDFYS